MSMLRKEWSREEIENLTYDMKTARVKVFINWGFDVSEISRVMELPESIIRAMINE